MEGKIVQKTHNSRRKRTSFNVVFRLELVNIIVLFLSLLIAGVPAYPLGKYIKLARLEINALANDPKLDKNVP